MTSAPLLVYFSSVSGNTARFVDKLGMPAVRIPIHANEELPAVEEPFVLVTPNYGGRFLNSERNRSLIRGVISAGNSNFGESVGLAGDIISRKCHVPHLYRLEVFCTPEDVARVSEGLERWWQRQ